MSPALKLATALFALLYSLKAFTLTTRRNRPQTPAALFAFLFAWPGVIPNYFHHRQEPQPILPTPFLAAWARTALGALSILLLAIYALQLSDQLLGLAGVAALLLTIHLGICDLLPWILRWAGFSVPLLFDRPWAAASLTDFWSRRWNLAFSDMNQRLFLRTFHRRFGKPGALLAIFVLSGLLHELGLSFPAGAGWGLPLSYFLLHGLLVIAEERFQIRSRIWTWFWVIAPSPWLFHAPFRSALIVPFYRWLHGLIAQHPPTWYLSHLIYAAAIGQMLVLIASFQVPTRLGWKRDIPKLTRFNQKVFWVYSFYILFCIVSFGAMTWRLHGQFLAGDPTARCLAIFIATFWTVRVLVDLFWYDHGDWPQGNALSAGHALVTTLFCTLAAIYWFVVFA